MEIAQNGMRGLPVRRGRVLIIDDEIRVARGFRRLLAREYDVDIADCGRGGHELLIDHGADYDVILCDLMMPGINGMNLYRSMLTMNPEVASRMVFMTAGAFTDAGRAFLATNPNLHVDKPLASEDLCALVHERVAARSSTNLDTRAQLSKK